MVKFYNNMKRYELEVIFKKRSKNYLLAAAWIDFLTFTCSTVIFNIFCMSNEFIVKLSMKYSPIFTELVSRILC